MISRQPPAFLWAASFTGKHMSDNHTEHSVLPAVTKVIPEQPASPATYLDSELNCPELKQRLETFQSLVG